METIDQEPAENYNTIMVQLSNQVLMNHNIKGQLDIHECNLYVFIISVKLLYIGDDFSVNPLWSGFCLSINNWLDSSFQYWFQDFSENWSYSHSPSHRFSDGDIR